MNDNNDDLVSEFDASTCSGDSVYEIFDNNDEIIVEDSTVWVNTNDTIWEGKVIKITYCDLRQDSNNLKMICINTKKEERILIKLL